MFDTVQTSLASLSTLAKGGYLKQASRSPAGEPHWLIDTG